MRKWIAAISVFALLLAGVWAFGPRPSMDVSARYDEATLPEDLDGYLALTEATIKDITPGAEKEIIWAGEAGAPTPISVVYLHGFSATKAEIRPVPDRIAAALGANLYFARLTGHGRPGAALGEATADDWWRDALEALAIGRRLGDRVLVIATSTGATLAATALAEGEPDVIGLIGVSPNFAVKAAPVALLTAPFGEYVLPLIFGSEYSWEAQNEAQEKWWATSYPLTALLEMGAVVGAAQGAAFEKTRTPALFIFLDEDETVDHGATRRVASSWGGGATMENPPLSGEISPSSHVIAGDIVSPDGTDPVLKAAMNWLESLGISG